MTESDPVDASGESAPQKQSHKFFSPYSRRQIGIMLVAVLLGVAAVSHAHRLLTVNEPPPVSTEPVLSLVLSPGGQQLSWATATEYQVVETFRRCQNPVSVELDALVNGTDIGGPTTAPHGYAVGELVDPLGQPGNVELLENQTFPLPHWIVPRGEFVRHAGHGTLFFGAPVKTWFPSVVQYGMAATSTTRAVLVELRFQENWVLPRSGGTCFVRIPSLQAEFVDPTDGANLYTSAFATGAGAVSVVSTTGEAVDFQNSVPPPTDPRIPQWSCASMAVTPAASAPNCGGVAVFSAPGAGSHVSLWLLIDGALIGVAAALFVDPATKFRGRKDKPSAEGSTATE